MRNTITQKLTAALELIEISVIDESHLHAGHAGAREGGESHFAITVVSDKFIGLSRVQRHKIVYGILDNELKTDVHALRIAALTPEEG